MFTKIELQESIASNSNISLAQADVVVDALVRDMAAALVRGEGIEIPLFGTFSLVPVENTIHLSEDGTRAAEIVSADRVVFEPALALQGLMAFAANHPPFDWSARPAEPNDA